MLYSDKTQKDCLNDSFSKFLFDSKDNVFTVDLSGFAKTLHELMRYIGFDEMVKRESRVGGFVKEEFIPKWKLITSHTARRTFITVNVMRGFNIMEIRRASGHASQSTFERYLCYTDDY